MPRLVVPILVPELAALAQGVELAVERQDQRGVLGDAEIVAGDRDALLGEPLDLVDERMRIEHDAVADDRELARAHDARRAAARACRPVPPMTSVWPALWPPWKRTTTSACSESQSTILPLPSSPHWAPTTTTFAIADL